MQEFPDIWPVKIKFQKYPFLILLAITIPGISNSQSGADFKLLLQDDATLYKKTEERERITDLVKVCTYDSVITKATQRHVLFIAGVMMNMVGLKWRRLEGVKQKYVGTASRKMKMFRGPGKEFDYNIFLTPHLPKYVKMIRYAYDSASHFSKSDVSYKIDSARWPCPPELVHEGRCLSVECECSPNAEFVEELDSLFIPSNREHKGYQHKNFHVAFPSVGLYGPLCLDCNHKCRPEIHPINWIWWLDIDSAVTKFNRERIWHIGLLKDMSNRFDDWNTSPLTGEISIPFFIPASGTKSLEITFTPLVIDKLISGQFAKEEADRGFGIPPMQMKPLVNGVKEQEGPPVFLQGTNFEGNGDGLIYVLEKFPVEGGYAGFLHLYVSAETLFTAEVKMVWK